MKKLLLSTVALVGLASTAFAADLPIRRAPPAPYVAVPVFTWTGFYVGVNAGYGWNNNDRNNNYYGYYGSTYSPYYYGDNSNDGGFVGGGQIGYNFQTGMFVFGVEADLQYADLGNNRDNSYYGSSYYGSSYYYGGHKDNGNYFGTVRARAGVAFDRFLVYATGGFAYGDVGGRNNGGCYYGASTYYYGGCSNSDTNTGWTVGGGVEYAFTNNLTAKIEGLYVNLDSGRNNDYYYYTTATPYYYGDRKNNNEFGVVRVGLNYKFGTY